MRFTTDKNEIPEERLLKKMRYVITRHLDSRKTNEIWLGSLGKITRPYIARLKHNSKTLKS